MNKILLIPPPGLAQALLLTPALSVLKKNFPKAKITVLGRGASILHGHPAVNRVLGAASLKDFKETGYNLAILFYPSFKYSLLAKLAGIKKIIAPQSLTSKFLVTDALPPAPADKPQAQAFLDMLSPLFIYSYPAPISLPVDKKENEKAKKYLAALGLGEEDKFTVLNIPAQNCNKTFWAQLISRIKLAAPDTKMLFACLSPAEEKAAKGITAALAVKPLITAPLEPLVFAAVLNRAQIIMCCAPCAGHIAAALGKPSIIFTVKDKDCPQSPEARIIPLKPGGAEVFNNIPAEQVLDLFITITKTENKTQKGIFNEKGTFS